MFRWGRTSAGTLTFILSEGCHGAAPPWGPGPPASVAPWEEASGVLGPRPLSAQAGPYLNPHKAGFPYPLAEPKDRVRTGVGLVYNHYLASGGTYILTHVCVCV